MKMETIRLTEELWEAEVRAWDAIKDPKLILDFEERVVRYLVEVILSKPDEALSEIENVENIVLYHPIETDVFVKKFIAGIRCNISAAASTLRHYLGNGCNMEDELEEIVSQAQTAFKRNDLDGTVDAFGRIGVLLLKGKKLDRKLECELSESGLGDYLRGAKNVRYVALTNNLDLLVSPKKSS